MSPEIEYEIESTQLPIRKAFGTAIGCMDGRTIEPVQKFVQELDEEIGPVDSVTGAGLVKYLADPDKYPDVVKSVEERVDVSVHHHKTKVICVYGHEACAGHPVDQAKHKEDILKAADTVRQFKLVKENNVPVVTVFVAKDETPQKRQMWFVEVLQRVRKPMS